MMDTQKSNKRHAKNIEAQRGEEIVNLSGANIFKSGSSTKKLLMRSAFAFAGMISVQVVSPSGAAFGNEIHGNHAWQFRSVGERTLSLQQLDLMMRRNAGGYNNFFSNTYNTYV